MIGRGGGCGGGTSWFLGWVWGRWGRPICWSHLSSVSLLAAALAALVSCCALLSSSLWSGAASHRYLKTPEMLWPWSSGLSWELGSVRGLGRGVLAPALGSPRPGVPGLLLLSSRLASRAFSSF